MLSDISASAVVGDSYSRLIDLLSMPGVKAEYVEGFVTFQSFGATVFYQSAGGDAPLSGSVGVQWAAGSGFGLGPRQTPGAGWRLDRIWLKNTTAGSAAVVVVQGIVDVL